jgi:phage-related protein
MSMVEEVGWPKALDLRFGLGKKRKRRIVKKDDFIYILKCTPDCWRLYFYVDLERKYFVYVHAVCKKQDEEDPADVGTARQRYDERTAGGLEEISFKA